MVELVVRLVFSLAVVLGLLLLCARVAGRRFVGRRDAMVRVVHRQPLSRGASVSVVSVAGRVLVLGTTDQGVRLLTELDPDELAAVTGDGVDTSALDAPLLATEEPTSGEATVAALSLVPRHRAEAPRAGAADVGAATGPLAGSLLAPQTWKQAWGAVTGRAS